MPDQTTVVDILLVEDNSTDAELCIRALKKHNLANNLIWLKDGEEALEFLFATGRHKARGFRIGPRSCYWICVCQRLMVWRCCGRSRQMSARGPFQSLS